MVLIAFRYRLRNRLLPLLLGGFFLAGVLGAAQSASIAKPADPTASVDAVLIQNAGDASLDLPMLRRFYAKRAFQPVWAAGPSRSSPSALAQRILETADREGLDPAVYHVKELQLLQDRESPADLGKREILLTDGLLKYARDVRVGRVRPANVDSDIDLPAQAFDPAGAVEAALANNALQQFLAGLPPPHAEYSALRGQLARYREIERRGGWKALPEMPKVLDPGGPEFALLRARLAAEDPSLALSNETPEDGQGVAQALLSFQRSHGLEADGIPGPKTLAEFNVPVGERISQIVSNMERWRWLPRQFERSYIEVNVPDASLELVRDGQVVLSSRIVVGKPNDRTPILRAMATGVTLNPPWDIPMTIARREYLPVLRRDPSYLARNGIVIVGRADDPSGTTIDWSAVSASEFEYRFRQLPGANNALGKIKLEMPNRFNVYLHDTPSPSAFERADRDLSHGCMRVEQILPLASGVLSGNGSGLLGELDREIASGETVRLPLKEPLPVYVLYQTAFVAASGEMQFRRDLYGRDGRLNAALARATGTDRMAALGCPAIG